jgi:hypothetical protein
MFIFVWLVLFSILNVILLKDNTPKFWYDDHKGYFGWPDDTQDWKWLDVNRVEIVTTDEGPWNEDLYWLISFKNSNECIVIPQGAEGGNAMVKLIPKVLGEPDWVVATEAICCCSNNRFLIWSNDSDCKEVDKHVG